MNAQTHYDRSRVYQVNLDPKNENDARIIASKYVPPGSVVLDVGSACGDFGLLLNKQKKCEMHGLEFSQKSIEIANQTGAYATINQVDLSCFDSRNFEKYSGYFDAIVLLDVLEHIVYPDKAFNALKGFLKKNGIFIVSLPNVAFGDVKLKLLADDFTYTETGILDETHVRFFTFRTIADFLSRQGVRILDCAVVVADVPRNGHRVPSRVRSYILKDSHSYVYQYVIKAEPSALDMDTLMEFNLSKMDIRWDQINSRLRSIRRKKLLNAVFPPGSRRRQVVKRLLGSFRHPA